MDGLVKHWHAYRRSLKKLQRFLAGARTLLPSAGPARCSVQQLQRSLQDLQVRTGTGTGRLFRRNQLQVDEISTRFLFEL